MSPYSSYSFLIRINKDKLIFNHDVYFSHDVFNKLLKLIKSNCQQLSSTSWEQLCQLNLIRVGKVCLQNCCP